MRKMKKRLLTFLVCGMLLFSMAACGAVSGKKKVDGAAMVQALLDQVTFAGPLSDVGDSAFLYFTDLPEGTQVKYYTGSGYYADAVALITLAKTSDAVAAMASVEAYLAQTRNLFANYIPEELDKIDKAIVWESGRHIILCITDDHVKANKLLKSGDMGHQNPDSLNNTIGVQSPTNGTVKLPATTAPTIPATSVPQSSAPIGGGDTNGYPIITSKTGTWTTYKTGIVVDNAGFEVCGYNDSIAASYAAQVNKVADALQGKTKVYCLPIPTGYGIMLPDDIQVKQPEYVNPVLSVQHLDAHLNANVTTVHCADNLMRHRNEYLYFRTDHHWNGKGAYYAYEAFCETKGIQPYTLAQREEVVREGFLGTLYTNFDKNEALLPADTIYAYKPYCAGATMVFYDQNGTAVNWPIISGADNYNIFAGSDNPLAVFTNPEVTDGSVCIVVKESFANALLPYLVDHYSTIYEVDYRYWSGDLIEYAKEVGADEMIFANNLGMIVTGSMVAKLANVIH